MPYIVLREKINYSYAGWLQNSKIVQLPNNLRTINLTFVALDFSILYALGLSFETLKNIFEIQQLLSAFSF